MNSPNRASLRKTLTAQLKWLVPVLLLAAIAAGWWWFRIVPKRVEGFYDQAVEEYRDGNYPAAIRTLSEAYRLNSRVLRVNILLGWSHWRLGHAKEAEFYFARAHRLDSSAEEAKLGLAFSSLALQHFQVALLLFQELARKHPNDKEIQMSLGEAYIQSGQNLEAAKTYRAMVERDPSDLNARRQFLSLYGYPDYRPDLPLAPQPRPRPAERQLLFRTKGDYFQALVGTEWKTMYSMGVNLGPARPGEFPSTPGRDFVTYFEWLEQMARMNCNTVRLYTVLPPAFYQAFKAYNETAPSPIWLIQEIWIHDEVENLYDPETDREFQQDVANVIDLLHGQANLAYRRGHNYGIYTTDVSRYVLALGVGREVEPRVVLVTNEKNSSVTSYQGRYVSLPQGTPSEAWFARMCDLAARYELEKYNAQRPLTVVNWPPLDPMTHPAENTYTDELRIRKSLGEVVPEQLPSEINDADVASVDITKFKVEPDFPAGLFALYHVYQHWPDFLLHEPSYMQARDAQGPNPYLGYLRELKQAHKNFPLLIGEYGLSTSLAAAHLHPLGWNNGGLTERQQADLLVRFTKNIRDTGCAGSIVFAWQDEWFKHVHDSFTADFERPWDRNPLWLNVLDPEKNFGIVGYEAAILAPALRGDADDWQKAQQLYAPQSAPSPSAGTDDLRGVYAISDYAYLYLRIDVEPGSIDWGSRNYWIALNTLPGESGSRLLPEIGVRQETGANFLLELSGPTSSRILIAENYNPNGRMPIPGRPAQFRIWRKQGMKIELADSAAFEEIKTEANAPRYAHDGRIFPAVDYSRSALPYGTAERVSPQFSSHALWHVEPRKGLIELRIPWGLLLMSDPSNLEAFGGTDEKWTPQSRPTKGISVAVFILSAPRPGQTAPKAVVNSVPALRDGRQVEPPAIYSWQRWNRVEVRPYYKQSYFALQKLFGEILKKRK